ncbi:MAG: 3'(2'),5'-bisphosphate nucleotidase CysQ [Rhodospirillales bacterium]
MDYEKIGLTLRRLVVEAGAATMTYFGTDALKVEAKEDQSPVTAADHAADQIIVAGLERDCPEIAVVTEERAETHGKAPDGPFFLVDPLDGTKEFVSGRGDFTVNIALIEKGEPTMGAVFAPAKQRLFWTRSPGEALQESGEIAADRVGGTTPLKVRPADNAALGVVASKSHRDAATDSYIARYSVADFKSAGSSLKFCLIAGGEADLYPRLGRTMEWDTAAAHAVLRAAGGRVDSAFGGTLRYGKAGFENPHFIAYSPDVRLIEA